MFAPNKRCKPNELWKLQTPNFYHSRADFSVFIYLEPAGTEATGAGILVATYFWLQGIFPTESLHKCLDQQEGKDLSCNASKGGLVPKIYEGQQRSMLWNDPHWTTDGAEEEVGSRCWNSSNKELMDNFVLVNQSWFFSFLNCFTMDPISLQWIG